MSDFRGPIIFDDSFDGPTLVERQLADQLTTGFVDKSELYLSMSAFEKVPPAEVIGEFLLVHSADSFIVQSVC